MWLAVVRVFDSGWRGQYSEILGILERFAGRRRWLKRSQRIEMIDLPEKWRKLVNHGVEERGRVIRAYAKFMFILFLKCSSHIWLWSCLRYVILVISECDMKENLGAEVVERP